MIHLSNLQIVIEEYSSNPVTLYFLEILVGQHYKFLLIRSLCYQ